VLNFFETYFWQTNISLILFMRENIKILTSTFRKINTPNILNDFYNHFYHIYDKVIKHINNFFPLVLIIYNRFYDFYNDNDYLQ
jgi:hypothetical protein